MIVKFTYVWVVLVISTVGLGITMYTCNKEVASPQQAGNLTVAPAREKTQTTTTKKITKTPDGKTVTEIKTVKEQDVTTPVQIKAVLPKHKLTVGVVSPIKDAFLKEKEYELIYERRLWDSPFWVGAGATTDGKAKITIGVEL